MLTVEEEKNPEEVKEPLTEEDLFQIEIQQIYPDITFFTQHQ